jgi:hypothetical protein
MTHKKIKNNLRSHKQKTNNSLQPTASRSNKELYPKFSLEHLQINSDYCLSRCNKEQKAAFADTIKNLSQLQWKQIIDAPSLGNGYEIIAENSFKLKIPAKFKELAKNFAAFRFYGKSPMVWSIDHYTFYILWFDHNFTLYDR